MKETYYAKMTPYASRAATALNIPVEVVLAQWAHESDYGKSSLANRANNHAGIKNISRGKDFTSGIYAGYNSLNSFTNDYIRVLNLPYYDKVRGQQTIKGAVKALDQSPYAEDKAYGSKLLNILGQAEDISMKDFNVISQAKENVESLDNDSLKNYATIGAAVLVVVGLLKD